jgi:hypothetical protein
MRFDDRSAGPAEFLLVGPEGAAVWAVGTAEKMMACCMDAAGVPMPLPLSCSPRFNPERICS